MQEAENYAIGHIEGSVNIIRNDVVVNTPYPTMIAPAKQIAEVLGNAGIDNDTLVIIYDDSGNINAARLWWTMLVYGHQNVKVVSGGFSALQKAGLALSTDAPAVQAKTYEPGEADVYVFPRFLPEEVPTEVVNNWKRAHDVKTYQYKMNWLNYYVIQSFIVALGRKTKADHIWRNGISVYTEEGWLFRVELHQKKSTIILMIEAQAEEDAVNAASVAPSMISKVRPVCVWTF